MVQSWTIRAQVGNFTNCVLQVGTQHFAHVSFQIRGEGTLVYEASIVTGMVLVLPLLWGIFRSKPKEKKNCWNALHIQFISAFLLSNTTLLNKKKRGYFYFWSLQEDRHKSTWSPKYPGGQRHWPSPGSHVAPFWQSQLWLQYQP